MMRGGLVKNRVLNCHQQLVFPSAKATSQGEIARLYDDSLPNHVPKLLLGNPVLFVIVT